MLCRFRVKRAHRHPFVSHSLSLTLALSFSPSRFGPSSSNFRLGVGAPLLSITVVRTFSFSIYQKAKYTYDRWIYNVTGTSPLIHANTKGAWPSLGTITCFGAAGATSGALITWIACELLFPLCD